VNIENICADARYRTTRYCEVFSESSFTLLCVSPEQHVHTAAMDLLRRFVDGPPDLVPFREVKPTLLVSWWCTFYAIVVILIRVGGRWVRAEKLFKEDGIMLLAIIPLLMRMAFVHVVLLFGTNNTVTDELTPGQISQRQIGSQLVLASRVMYAA
jgi:hypothetical protein